MNRALILALVLVAGCAEASRVGYFDDQAFYTVRQHYRIRYLPDARASRALLGSEWRPLNLEFENGVPTQGRWTREDQTRIWLDHDGDGRGDLHTTGERFDLRFEHRQNGASLLVRTSPIAESLGERSVDVLVHDILDRVAGGTQQSGSVEVVRIVHEGPVRVGGADAYQAVFEGAALGPTGDVIATSTDRAQVVFVRPRTRWRDGGRSAPMVVSFWLVARREHFDGLMPALSSLLDRTDFRDHLDTAR
ncbi:hypothetical protein [Sandaracinus amylolyticus]|uniref:Lipoprotein n=1 Tax=Sandaracinus amylolyticus TaxID=927083 RepID=A0A0F6YHM6_9BACT|nr:hypothetical protein [Sandaracinus amylolyticus]AKF05232.1 hypothetical protein DB32_002381 [Sandaracinus amylolyticus]